LKTRKEEAPMQAVSPAWGLCFSSQMHVYATQLFHFHHSGLPGRPALFGTSVVKTLSAMDQGRIVKVHLKVSL